MVNLHVLPFIGIFENYDEIEILSGTNWNEEPLIIIILGKCSTLNIPNAAKWSVYDLIFNLNARAILQAQRLSRCTISNN